MPPSTAWRRRDESTPRRTTSPTRPGAESIERLSPEPFPVTPTSTYHSANRARGEVNGSHSSTLQGLGLSHTTFGRSSVKEHDHLHLDADGRAHPVLGAKLKSPKQREHTARAPSTLYRGPPKRNHARTTSAMSIDDLANAAIYSTSPQFNQNPTFSFGTSPVFHSTSRPSTSYHNGYTQESYDRPAKRIKSERMYSADWTRGDRPWSSYDTQTEVRQEDAELLLGLRNDINWKHTPRLPSVASAKVEPDREDYMVKQEPTSPQHFAYNERDQWSFDPSPAPVTEADQFRKAVQVDGAAYDHKQPTLDHDGTIEEENYVPAIQTATGTAESTVEHKQDLQIDPPVSEANTPKPRRVPVAETQPVCPLCQKVNSTARGGEATMEWIQCEGSCTRWFHLPCAGFTAQSVKRVAKYICQDCRPEHGETTFTRTSTRARAALDYAALNEGVAMSNEHDSMHHFVPGLKSGTTHYYQDNFARIRPELVTQELWENFDGMKRPFVVPSLCNPRFGIPDPAVEGQSFAYDEAVKPFIKVMDKADDGVEEEDITTELEMDSEMIGLDEVLDVDQDYLDMVMPRDLTVPQVAELYGPEETLEVIDVKTQKTSAKYTLRQWAAYYAEQGLKEIKNVISLEVSHSRLGRLIRRPKVVRDIDLEDQVWDKESRDAFKKRPVAFYCLMSVGDSYTDFHIDMGGSSVYYHILKGKKVFFFIPPTDKYLKEYEKWNNNQKQSEIWLGDQCDGNVTRVDLYPGDTAFIPAGWIHSVWTPEDSLVIGGNFLTRYDLEMQLKIRDIEKATGTSMKFTYPHFQRIMWYTAVKYLDDDPVPESIIDDFELDPEHRYLRAWPVWQEQEIAPDVEPEEGDYNDHHYSKSEAKDWPVLRDWLYRTARINADLPVTPAVSKDDARKIKGSVPKNHGDPMQVICLFAVWVAWKRGNELVPSWVHTDPTIETVKQTAKQKADKLHIPPERRSSRKAKDRASSPALTDRPDTPDTDDTESATNKHPPRRIACSACRKEKKACRHPLSVKVEESAQQTLEKPRHYSNVSLDIAKLARATQNAPVVASIEGLAAPPTSAIPAPLDVQPATLVDENVLDMSPNSDLAQAALERLSSQPSDSNGTMMNGVTPSPNAAKKGRSKACDDCRKSKVRRTPGIKPRELTPNSGDAFMTSTVESILPKLQNLQSLVAQVAQNVRRS